MEHSMFKGNKYLKKIFELYYNINVKSNNIKEN